MGCGTSATRNPANKSERAIKAAILIQKWYRSYMAHLEMRRRYSLSIFQSIEYADEQAQLQLSKFFTFMLDHFTEANETDPANDRSSDLPVIEYYEKTIKVPDSYYGPRLCFPLSVTDTEVLLQAFKNQQQLHARYVLQLFHETRKVLQQMPNITRLSTSYAKEITICGDLHGKLDDLLLIFYKIPKKYLYSYTSRVNITVEKLEKVKTPQLLISKPESTVNNGLPSEENPYVFNGDFVDRGKHSIEILIILFAFFLIYPNHLHLNRGNHEDHIMNLRYGFTKEIMKKYQSYGKPIVHLLQDVYSKLPLATIIDSQVLILHGGISDTTDLNVLNLIQRNKLKSLLKPVISNIEAVYEPPKKHVMKTSSKHIEIKKCDSGQDFGNKNLIRSKSESCGNRKYSSKLCDDKGNLDGISDRANSSSSSELTKKEWEQVMNILWSDPKHQNGCTPNKVRGGGCYFGPDVTARFLEHFNLKFLIRSHQCKQEGYEISHNGKVITIFSASNYYEEGSNRGAYIKLNPDLIPRFVQYQVSKSTRKLTLHQRVTAIEASALKCLQEKIYSHKSDLIAAFTQYDPVCTGRIDPSQWASAVESVLHLDLPWRTLRSRLVRQSADGSVEYHSSFESLEIKLPIKEVQPFLVETLCRYKADLGIIFNMIDQDHSGLISVDEFCQAWKLFNLHLKNEVSDEAIESLARIMDFNKDGSIDFNEFLKAFHVVHKFEDRYSH